MLKTTIQYIIILLLFSTFLLISCKRTTKFDREAYVFRYLNEIQNFPTKDTSFYLFIISNSACNCSGDLNVIFKELDLNTTEQNKIFVFAKEDSILEQSIQKNIRKYSIIIDKDSNLRKYGLNNATHYFFDIKNEKIIYWNNIDNSLKDEIKQYIEKKK
ncbi:MAG: hypothetical protein H6553_13610 [Chitinophagales bacterium]|nr:hypothetical protein [Chitinophagales bacterium]